MSIVDGHRPVLAHHVIALLLFFLLVSLTRQASSLFHIYESLVNIQACFYFLINNVRDINFMHAHALLRCLVSALLYRIISYI